MVVSFQNERETLINVRLSTDLEIHHVCYRTFKNASRSYHAPLKNMEIRSLP